METEDFTYIVETEKNFDEAVVSVLKTVESLGWTLFNVYDTEKIEFAQTRYFNGEILKFNFRGAQELQTRSGINSRVLDIKERLAVKGFEQKQLKIIEICSGKYANNFLNQNRLISLCMPCKINVFEEDEKVKIAGMKPTIMSQFFKELKKEEMEEVEKVIKCVGSRHMSHYNS